MQKPSLLLQPHWELLRRSSPICSSPSCTSRYLSINLFHYLSSVFVVVVVLITFSLLDSASSTFLQCLNRRVSTATVELNLLDSMSFATVSFEELLGHCYEVFNSNQSCLLHLQSLLKPLGYVPGALSFTYSNSCLLGFYLIWCCNLVEC